MAARKSASRKSAPKRRSLPRPDLRRWLRRVAIGVVALMLAAVLIFRWVPVPMTPYMLTERLRLGSLQHEWTPWDQIAPVMGRSAVAAEDANFCRHWGFDMAAIRDAVAEGSNRGASTISQQTAKNVFLWHGRSWPRKALEALMTPVIETLWSKRRILEVYLNVAEFDEGVFGVEAAARHYFGVDAADLTATQAARLAAVLPNPKGRDAAHPTNFVLGRAQAAASGAATIRADGRARCFEG
ncbi:monofunctional biosynthetic peptidoglycan transglycosylase [Falsirhodobacter algicola]|uniref:Biosynthetic peptidoglycan transglycosylase n=1 Tax=Falsirhodobacter algicola TaxID=2692330 RepID=A0A8J8SLW9_9RHOB|nr:monofunctional biosynthetic peptidoglycan transglycosylase [Falsirhodobacter algicola]QUS36927.1 monofunctional biosynthetic peptidoglycan transglycosylase [Falsirhodobacter algicola]